MNRDITWPKILEEMSYEAYDRINKLLTENPAQRLGAIGAVQVEMHHFFKNIHWDTLARQKATFIPSVETLDTSYFMSRSIWNPEDEQVDGGNNFDDMSDTGSTFGDSSFGNMLEEEVNALLSYLEIDNHEGLVMEHLPGRYAELDQYWGESQVMGPGPDGWADEFSQEHGRDPNAWALSFEQQHGANADDVCGPNGRSSTFINNGWTLTRNGESIGREIVNFSKQNKGLIEREKRKHQHSMANKNKKDKDMRKKSLCLAAWTNFVAPDRPCQSW
ncbi:unnamed protein product [Lactuca saligna]|uniref:non-specific serine/threonine protein kinase n=1 Tax=Lactuca saligna TaxID=75948 RepID=A0AA35Z6B8_LACSI|nr:unnamed protein product [Lactuca saligna]